MLAHGRKAAVSHHAGERYDADKTKGVRGRSWLLDLPYFDIVTMTLPDPMHIISGSLGAHLVPVTQGKRLSSVLANAEREAWENDRREEKKEEDSASRAVRDDQRDRASSRNLVKNARRSKAAQANAIARELDNKAAAAAKPAAKGRRSFYASASEESKEEEEEKKHEPVLARPRVVSASGAESECGV